MTAPFPQARPATDPIAPPRRPYSVVEPAGTAPSPSAIGPTTQPPGRPQVATYAPAAARPRRGPHGCLLGGLASLILLVVLGLFAWTVTKPLVSNRVRDELNQSIATQVADLDTPRLQAAGQLTLTEDEINAEIDQYAASYDPVKNVRVGITPDEVQVRFDLYGTTSTLRGDLAVEGGRIVVVDPKLSGPAGQVIDKDDIVEVFEAQLASLMTLSNVEPTAVELGDGQLTITTRRKGA